MLMMLGEIVQSPTAQTVISHRQILFAIEVITTIEKQNFTTSMRGITTPNGGDSFNRQMYLV